jgi:hypothetical protein
MTVARLSRPMCCSHEPDRHELIGICREEVRYAHEELPCPCHEAADSATRGTCAGCGHAASSHSMIVICRPEEGICGCVEHLR